MGSTFIYSKSKFKFLIDTTNLQKKMHNNTHECTKMNSRHTNNSHKCMAGFIVTDTRHCYVAWLWSLTNFVHGEQDTSLSPSIYSPILSVLSPAFPFRCTNFFWPLTPPRYLPTPQYAHM